MNEVVRLHLLERIKSSRSAYEAARAFRDAKKAFHATMDAELAAFRAKYVAADSPAARNAARFENAVIDSAYKDACKYELQSYEKALFHTRDFLLHRAARAARARADYEADLTAARAARETNLAARAAYDSDLASALAEYDSLRAIARADFEAARSDYCSACATARATFSAALGVADVFSNTRQSDYKSACAIARTNYVNAYAIARADFEAARSDYCSACATARATFSAALGAADARAARNAAHAEFAAKRAESAHSSRTDEHIKYADFAAACDETLVTSLVTFDDDLDDAYDDYNFAQTVYDDAIANYGANYESSRIAALAAVNATCEAAKGTYMASLVEYPSACDAACTAHDTARAEYDAASAANDVARVRGLTAFRDTCEAARTDYYVAIAVAIHTHKVSQVKTKNFTNTSYSNEEEAGKALGINIHKPSPVNPPPLKPPPLKPPPSTAAQNIDFTNDTNDGAAPITGCTGPCGTVTNDPDITVFSVLTCSGETSFSAMFQQFAQRRLGEQFDVRVTDRWQEDEIRELVSRESFDLIVPYINNIKYPGDRHDWPIRAVELLRHLKAQCATPMIACCARGIPETLDLPDQLTAAGVDALLWTPFSSAEVLKALEICLDGGSRFLGGGVSP